MVRCLPMRFLLLAVSLTAFGQNLIEFDGVRTTYQPIDGFAVVYGDIIAARLEDLVIKPGARYALATSGALWPNGTIPYVFDSDVPTLTRTRFADAVTEWQTKTLIRLIPRNGEAAYVRVRRGTDARACSANVGWFAGESMITLPDNCSTGSIVHEIGHTVGLWHEQQRRDRDAFVEMVYPNIIAEFATNFDKIRLDGGRDVGSYNFASVMHYFSTAFNVGAGAETIRTIPPGIPLGSQVLSAGDIDAVQRLYGAPPSAVTVATNPPGLTLTVDGVTFTAPRTFTWILGTQHTLSTDAVLPLNSSQRRSFARWSDDGARSHTVTASPETTVYVASFTLQYSLILAPLPPQSGVRYTVTPLSDDRFYDAGTPVTLAAQESPGSALLSWVGLPTTVLLPGNTSKTPFTIPVQSWGTGAISTGKAPTFLITSEPEGRTITVDGSPATTPRAYSWMPGSTHTIRATDQTSGNSRYKFQRWSNGAAATQQVQAPADGGTLRATFSVEHRVTLEADPATGGTITTSPPSEDGFYLEGSTVTATASSRFRSWGVDLQGTTNPQSFTLTAPRRAVAHFTDPGLIQGLTISPAAGTVGVPLTQLLLSGTGFYEGITQVEWNGTLRPFLYDSPTQLRVLVGPADLAAAGAVQLAVINPASGRGVSVRWEVRPQAADCRFTLSTGTVRAVAQVSLESVDVTAPAGCVWGADTIPDWVRPFPPGPFTGSGTLSLKLQPNPSRQARTASILVGGQLLSIQQAGVACVPTLGPTIIAANQAGGRNYVSVAHFIEGCGWTASTTENWIRLVTSSGTTDGVLEIEVSPNVASGSRSGTVAIGGKTVTINQGSGPSITSVVHGATFTEGIAPNTWITIRGANLGGPPFPPGREWRGSDFTGGRLPTSLDGVTVRVNGQPAFISFMSDGQINALTPLSLAAGAVSVQVQVGNVTSNTFATTAQLTAPAFFTIEGRNAAAVHANGTLIGRTGLFAAAPDATTPAKPGESILLFGAGFGITSPAAPAGSVVSGALRLAELPLVRIAGSPATVDFAGLSATGLYQFNVRIPDGIAAGAAEVIAVVGGRESPPVEIFVE